MAKFVNTTTGPKGGYLRGSLVMVDPGQEAELDDVSDEWFAKVGGKPAKETAGE
jgi:hypothetical protein